MIRSGRREIPDLRMNSGSPSLNVFQNTNMLASSLSGMHFNHAISGFVLICMLLAFSGCTGTQNPPVTPVAVTSAGVAPSAAVTAGADLVPSPTDNLLEANKVNVNVEKDYLGNVIVTFQGGSGLQQVNKIDVALNRADGIVKTADVGITLDATATLEGTKNTDRVIVYVTMKDGRRYKIVDSLLPFRARP